MTWNDLPSWLKGGIIAVLLFGLVYIISLGVLVLLIFLTPPEVVFRYVIVLGIINFFLLYPGFILFSLSKGILSSAVISFCVSILTYFLIGALVGWIIGKIRSKEKKKRI